MYSVPCSKALQHSFRSVNFDYYMLCLCVCVFDYKSERQFGGTFSGNDDLVCLTERKLCKHLKKRTITIRTPITNNIVSDIVEKAIE